MDKEERIRLIKKLEKELNYRRFVHTMGVACTASALAMRYGEDMERAELAGLLHDCAKCLPLARMQELCRHSFLPVRAPEREDPALLHAKAGAALAELEYGVSDREILEAIAWHTTGRPAMSSLEKTIFIADYIEPGRKAAQHLPEIREAAFRNREEAMVMILSDTLSYLKRIGAMMDPMTQRTYEYYTEHLTAPDLTDKRVKE